MMPHPQAAPALQLIKRGVPQERADECRAERRFAVDQRVFVTLIEAPEFRVAARVRNVSRNGMRLEVDGYILNSGTAVKISWDNHAIGGTIRHRSQRDGSTILGVALSSSWESLLEEILARHTEELGRSHRDLQYLTCQASREMQETLSVVLLYLDLAVRRASGMEDQQTLELIRYAQSGALRFRDLTRDLAAYSRVITGSMNVTPVHCDRLVSAMASALNGPDASVTHDRLPILMGDGRDLRMVFQGLISNGLKFNRSPQRQVHVSAKYKGGEWVFAVQDNGIGIEAQAQEKLFEPFSRLHTDCEFPGSGLGLTLARRIVEKHSGRIWVESGPGTGSTFRFSIPASAKPWE